MTEPKSNIDFEKTPEFYKSFYKENRIALLQYKSLRKNFAKMVRDILGNNYYNLAMDVYECDRGCCEDITYKFNSLKKFWGWIDWRAK